MNIVTNEEHPVQIIFGKAHPADEPVALDSGSLSQCQELAQRRSSGILDDYDMDMARHLVQGVDIWLNTPRRPREASGTSGIKQR